MKKKTTEQFKQELQDIFGDEYELIGEYTSAHGKVNLKHSKCGRVFDKNVHDIITSHSGCPYCNGNKNRLYNEQWVVDNTPQPYKYIEGYVKMYGVKCKFYCEECGKYFYQHPSRLINEKIYGCGCSHTVKKTNEEFLEELGKECLEEYDILEPYKNIDTPIKIQHKTCLATFEMSPYNFIYKHQKKWCPECYYNKSYGEVLISSFLNKKKYSILQRIYFLRFCQ